MGTISIDFVVLTSVIALALSAYSVSVAKKHNDNADLTKLTETLTELSVEIKNMKDIILSKPPLSEQVAIHGQKISDHERRIEVLEKKECC